MSGDEPARLPHDQPALCAFAWCTTPHGATVHESDDDHRSAGRAVSLVRRGRGPAGNVERSEVEIGLLRRQSDSESWVVIEDGQGIHAEISVDSARELLTALRSDPAVARELSLEPNSL